MGYNTFGNILFYGLGMYLCASVQVGMFFPLAEWTESVIAHFSTLNIPSKS